MTTATFIPSVQQQAIFDWFKSGRGNLVVRARAGSGKTTTIIRGIDFAPESTILLAAFGKEIAEELKARLCNPRAEAATLHSLGFRIVRRYWSQIKVDGYRGRTLARQAAGADAPDDFVVCVDKLADLAKGAAPFARHEDLVDLAIEFGLLPDDETQDEGYDVDRLASVARTAMDLALEHDGTLGFSDMIYVPVVKRWGRPEYDLVVIDEAQDMNTAQLALALRVASGRVVVVGDDRQAIYAFRGADSGALDRLKTELEAAELGLTVTRRCPKVVVRAAQRLVPDFTAHEAAPDGRISELDGRDALLSAACPGDFVLSRKNAPLAGICLGLLRQGVRAMIAGKDIGEGLIRVIEKVAGKRQVTLPIFIEKLYKWEAQQLAKVQASGHRNAEARCEFIRDQIATIIALADGVSTVRELTARVEDLFVNVKMCRDNAVVCSTIHRAKGLEAERVFMLADTLYPGGRVNQEEQNLHYVALTRAKRELVHVYAIG